MIITVSKEHTAKALILINNCYLAMTPTDKAIIHNTPINKEDARKLRIVLNTLYDNGIFNEEELNGKQQILLTKLLKKDCKINQYNIEKQ